MRSKAGEYNICGTLIWLTHCPFKIISTDKMAAQCMMGALRVILLKTQHQPPTSKVRELNASSDTQTTCKKLLVYAVLTIHFEYSDNLKANRLVFFAQIQPLITCLGSQQI